MLQKCIAFSCFRMQRHFNDYWTISFYNKRKYSICCKWSKTKKYLRTEFKTNCLGLCWVWWRETATQKFPLLPSPSTRSPFPSVGQRLTSFSSLFLLNFFSISSHCSSVFLLTPTQYFFSPLLRCGRQLSCFRRCTTQPTCPADQSDFMVVIDLTRWLGKHQLSL